METERQMALKKQRILNTDDKNKSLWLVKVPTFVSENWVNIQKNNGNNLLGTMKIINNNQGKVTSIKLNDDSEFTLEDLTSDPNMLVFSNTNKKNNVNHDDLDEADIKDINNKANKKKEKTIPKYTIVGKITKHMALKPVLNARYQEILRQRNDASHTTRTTSAVSDSVHNKVTDDTSMDFVPPVYAENKRRLSEMKQNSKKTYRNSNGQVIEPDNKILTDCLLSCFATNDKVTLKEILTHCNTTTYSDSAHKVGDLFTEREIKDNLLKYATYLSKGMYKHYYELKSDYKVGGN